MNFSRQISLVLLGVALVCGSTGATFGRPQLVGAGLSYGHSQAGYTQASGYNQAGSAYGYGVGGAPLGPYGGGLGGLPYGGGAGLVGGPGYATYGAGGFGGVPYGAGLGYQQAGAYQQGSGYQSSSAGYSSSGLNAGFGFGRRRR